MTLVIHSVLKKSHLTKNLINDSNTPELNYPLVEVKHENSEYVKRECDDEYEAEDLQHSVRV